MAFEARVHGWGGLVIGSEREKAVGTEGRPAAMPMARRSGFQRKREERAQVRACPAHTDAFVHGGPAAWRGRVSRPPVVAAPRSCQSSSEP